MFGEEQIIGLFVFASSKKPLLLLLLKKAVRMMIIAGLAGDVFVGQDKDFFPSFASTGRHP